MPVVMIGLAAVAMPMNMDPMTVSVRVDMPLLSQECKDQIPPEHDKQGPDSGLGDDFEPLRNTNPEREDDRSHSQQRRRMPHAPPKSDGSGRQERWSFGQHRRDGGQMIGVERVPQT